VPRLRLGRSRAWIGRWQADRYSNLLPDHAMTRKPADEVVVARPIERNGIRSVVVGGYWRTRIARLEILESNLLDVVELVVVVED